MLVRGGIIAFIVYGINEARPERVSRAWYEKNPQDLEGLRV